MEQVTREVKHLNLTRNELKNIVIEALEEAQLRKVTTPKRKRYSVADACEYLGISTKTLRKHTKSGAIVSHVAGGRVFYYQEDLEGWGRERRYKH